MASMRLFLFLATLTVIVAALVTTQAYPMPNEEPKKEEPSYHPTSPSCNDCNDAFKKRLLEARGKCCRQVSEHLKCLCPTMNTLIDAGIPLEEVCYDDMACKPTYKDPNNPLPADPLSKVVDTGNPCSVPTNFCDDLKRILLEQKQNGCTALDKAGDHSSQGSCFTKILSEIIGTENAKKFIEKLNHQ